MSQRIASRQEVSVEAESKGKRRRATDGASGTVEEIGAGPEPGSGEPRPRGGVSTAAEPCEICGADQSAIRINVDGNMLLMESCDGCDVRRWQLAGERIDLQEALNQVGEHTGRRR